MWKGRHDDYYWVVCAERSLWDLVTALPGLVVGKRVAVTAVDGGPLRLCEELLQDAWEQQGAVAVSPLIVDPSSIPTAQHGDEWYVLSDAIPGFGSFEVFVNFGSFSPVPVAELGWDDTWDYAGRRQIETRQDQFWEQVTRLQPCAYIGGGDLLTFVTKSQRDRDLAVERLTRR
jgi:hypothetical protein